MPGGRRHPCGASRGELKQRRAAGPSAIDRHPRARPARAGHARDSRARHRAPRESGRTRRGPQGSPCRSRLWLPNRSMPTASRACCGCSPAAASTPAMRSLRRRRCSGARGRRARDGDADRRPAVCRRCCSHCATRSSRHDAQACFTHVAPGRCLPCSTAAMRAGTDADAASATRTGSAGAPADSRRPPDAVGKYLGGGTT